MFIKCFLASYPAQEVRNIYNHTYNIQIYNNILLKGNPVTKKRPKTKYLLHTDSYDIMQHNLGPVIDEINGYISKLNKKVGASTPFLHDTIKEYRGRKGSRYFVYKWDRFEDGLHANEKLKERWGEVLSNTMRINDAKDEPEGDCSPKRSWKRAKLN